MSAKFSRTRRPVNVILRPAAGGSGPQLACLFSREALSECARVPAPLCTGVASRKTWVMVNAR